MKKIILLSLILFLVAKSFAGDISMAKVKNIMIDKKYGAKVFIELDKSLISRDAECHNSGRWEYVLDVSSDVGEKIYSNILVAYTMQQPADFFGSGECIHTGIEELRRLELVK